MSAILVHLGHLGDEAMRVALDAMRGSGQDERTHARTLGAVLAARWSPRHAPAGAADCIAMREDVAAVADAALYHRADLAGRLQRAGMAVPAQAGAAELILCAYLAWGDACTSRLEGDYAFVVVDRRRRLLFAARDLLGTRALYYTRAGGRITFASALGALRTLPAVSDELNLPVLAETASMSLTPADETAFRDVQMLPAGHSLVWPQPATHPSVRRWWRAPVFAADERPELTFDDARHVLRDLLDDAIRQRMPASGSCAITLSGGWDSPAVYGAAHGAGLPNPLRPISISYPPGDSGREDETIRAITAYHGQSPRWLDIGDIPLLGGIAAHAAGSDEPFLHVYRAWNEALAGAAAAEDAAVCLTGLGGDHLFQAEPAYLADLLMHGRVLELVREWSPAEMGTRAAVLRWLVQPVLARWAPALAPAGSADVPVPLFPDWRVPRWIESDFAQRADLAGRARAAAPAPDPAESVESYVRRWMFEQPLYGRVNGVATDIYRAHGVELRSPLMDDRIIAFAATRPRAERRSGGETKRLLRAAVADVLPAEVLAPRPHRTGTTTSYLRRSMRQHFGSIAEPLFRKPLLAELGIVNQRRLYAAGAAAERGAPDAPLAALLATLHTEIWLRAQQGIDVEAVVSADATRDEIALSASA
ncbi:MAG TPA: asparagine synthase-related protein [Longimicrobiales bacterium]|nr:asparagine synthase-related protein [Longimicrobiales bacterium]